MQRLDASNNLTTTEAVIFRDGFTALDTILRRAQICGWVGRYAQNVGDGNHFLDLIDATGDGLDVLPVSKEAWNYLKRKTKVRIFDFHAAIRAHQKRAEHAVSP